MRHWLHSRTIQLCFRKLEEWNMYGRGWNVIRHADPEDRKRLRRSPCSERVKVKLQSNKTFYIYRARDICRWCVWGCKPEKANIFVPFPEISLRQCHITSKLNGLEIEFNIVALKNFFFQRYHLYEIVAIEWVHWKEQCEHNLPQGCI
jgi:hypothetical protein